MVLYVVGVRDAHKMTIEYLQHVIEIDVGGKALGTTTHLRHLSIDQYSAEALIEDIACQHTHVGQTRKGGRRTHRNPRSHWMRSRVLRILHFLISTDLTPLATDTLTGLI